MQGDKEIPKSRVISKLGTAFLRWRRYEQQFIHPLGITLKQLYVLRQLLKEAYLYPSQIAEILFCDRPTATVIVNNLKCRGWVSSKVDPDRKKFMRIAITDAGRQKMDEIKASPFGNPSKWFDPMGCFDESEVAEFEKLLLKLNKHLEGLNNEGIEKE